MATAQVPPLGFAVLERPSARSWEVAMAGTSSPSHAGAANVDPRSRSSAPVRCRTRRRRDCCFHVGGGVRRAARDTSPPPRRAWSLAGLPTRARTRGPRPVTPGAATSARLPFRAERGGAGNHASLLVGTDDAVHPNSDSHRSASVGDHRGRPRRASQRERDGLPPDRAGSHSRTLDSPSTSVPARLSAASAQWKKSPATRACS